LEAPLVAWTQTVSKLATVLRDIKDVGANNALLVTLEIRSEDNLVSLALPAILLDQSPLCQILVLELVDAR
jgi:hypothetical protein